MGTGLRTLCACASALLLWCGSATAVMVTHSPASDDDLFGTKIVTLSVQISPTDLEVLRHNTDTHSYVPCTVSVGGGFPSPGPLLMLSGPFSTNPAVEFGSVSLEATA